jgi:hypothetical protein
VSGARSWEDEWRATWLSDQRARAACAAEINDGADRWRRFGKRSGYAKYARMLEAAQHGELSDRAPDEAPPRRRGRKRTLKHPCCWYCNDPFEFGNYIRVQARIGALTVHRDCVTFLEHDGLMEAPSETTSESGPEDE